VAVASSQAAGSPLPACTLAFAVHAAVVLGTPGWLTLGHGRCVVTSTVLGSEPCSGPGPSPAPGWICSLKLTAPSLHLPVCGICGFPGRRCHSKLPAPPTPLVQAAKEPSTHQTEPTSTDKTRHHHASRIQLHPCSELHKIRTGLTLAPKLLLHLLKVTWVGVSCPNYPGYCTEAPSLPPRRETFAALPRRRTSQPCMAVAVQPGTWLSLKLQHPQFASTVSSFPHVRRLSP